MFLRSAIKILSSLICINRQCVFSANKKTSGVLCKAIRDEKRTLSGGLKFEKTLLRDADQGGFERPALH
jgi:hypothetical protein